MSRVMNFNAGPGTLPLPALERAREELLDLAGSGMSVMEHSHRGKEYGVVHAEAQALLRELLGLEASWQILFLQGGASMQFAQIPMNLLGEGKVGEYVINGVWGEKALAEGKATAKSLGGSVRVAGSTAIAQGEGTTFTRVPRPDEVTVSKDAAYLHVTSNETIHGVEFEVGEVATGKGAEATRLPTPPAGVPLVCDASSDFLWKPTDLSRFSFVYAGAQKNIGPSGLVVALVRSELLERCRKDLPKIFRYDVAASNDSLYNTPPTWSVYLVRNVLAWCKSEGGLAGMETRNRKKAQLVYDAIDASGGFDRAPVERASRSVMNVVFRLPSTELEERFVAEGRKAGMAGLKGHRSVGGIRVSLYNAVPVPWAETLAAFMKDFAAKNG
jgi:phosphoserine aminotransferase